MKHSNEVSNRERLIIEYTVDYVLHEITEKAMRINSAEEVKICKAECIGAIEGGEIGVELFDAGE